MVDLIPFQRLINYCILVSFKRNIVFKSLYVTCLKHNHICTYNLWENIVGSRRGWRVGVYIPEIKNLLLLSYIFLLFLFWQAPGIRVFAPTNLGDGRPCPTDLWRGAKPLGKIFTDHQDQFESTRNPTAKSGLRSHAVPVRVVQCRIRTQPMEANFQAQHPSPPSTGVFEIQY